MSKEFEQLDNAQLLPKLKEWLESSPLYTEHRYTGGSLIKLPDEIELFWVNARGRRPGEMWLIGPRLRMTNCSCSSVVIAARTARSSRSTSCTRGTRNQRGQMGYPWWCLESTGSGPRSEERRVGKGSGSGVWRA